MGQEESKPRGWMPKRIEKSRYEIAVQKLFLYCQLYRDRRQSEVKGKEKALLELLKRPKRTKEDEASKVQSIIVDLNYIKASNVVLRFCEILKDRSFEVISNQGDPTRIADLLPYIESLIWATRRLNLNQVSEFQQLIYDCYGPNIMDNIERSTRIDNELKDCFKTTLPTPWDINEYFVKFAANYNFDIAEINKVGHNIGGLPPRPELNPFQGGPQFGNGGFPGGPGGFPGGPGGFPGGPGGFPGGPGGFPGGPGGFPGGPGGFPSGPGGFPGGPGGFTAPGGFNPGFPPNNFNPQPVDLNPFANGGFGTNQPNQFHAPAPSAPLQPQPFVPVGNTVQPTNSFQGLPGAGQVEQPKPQIQAPPPPVFEAPPFQQPGNSAPAPFMVPQAGPVATSMGGQGVYNDVPTFTKYQIDAPPGNPQPGNAPNDLEERVRRMRQGGL
eukprot:TRINITY_DN10814_c0_g3_i2.p1 TRINITY_DN10814_c0_g3~~TRINITY_DN10814_c0_g3_i2.p1  ORF type:complete len:440 (+),score=126.28 TRINITY_DN10814_c0_g3_i2:114-1433(+)